MIRWNGFRDRLHASCTTVSGWTCAQVDASPVGRLSNRLRSGLVARFQALKTWSNGQIETSPTVRIARRAKRAAFRVAGAMRRWLVAQYCSSPTVHATRYAIDTITLYRQEFWPWFRTSLTDTRKVRPMLCLRTAFCIVALGAIMQVEADHSFQNALASLSNHSPATRSIAFTTHLHGSLVAHYKDSSPP